MAQPVNNYQVAEDESSLSGTSRSQSKKWQHNGADRAQNKHHQNKQRQWHHASLLDSERRECGERPRRALQIERRRSRIPHPGLFDVNRSTISLPAKLQDHQQQPVWRYRRISCNESVNAITQIASPPVNDNQRRSAAAL